MSHIQSVSPSKFTGFAKSKTSFRLALILASSLIAISACSPSNEDIAEPVVEEVNLGREVDVTAAFTSTQSDTTAIGFLPNPTSASLGLIVSAPRDGGLDLFNADGEVLNRHSGLRLSGIATAPGFQLRGESLPLVFGASTDSDEIHGYAIVVDRSEILELPLSNISPVDGVAGLCLLREGAGFVDLAILGSGASAEIWRIRDAGEETLSVEQINQFSLPSPARQCVADEGDLILAGPASGLVRLDTSGQIQGSRTLAASGLAIGDFNGTRLVLITNGSDESIEAFNADDLEPFASIDVVDGLSTPGIGQPGAVAITDQSYGYTAYSTGMLAIFDNDDQRIKVVSREAFSRSLLASE